MSSEVLFEFSLSLDVEASEVLLVGLVHGEGAEYVKGHTATEVDGHWVSLAIVEETLKS